MGQQATTLTDRASARPLAEDSTLKTLCEGVSYSVMHYGENATPAWYAARTLQRLGFVVVTNVYSGEELDEL